MGPWAGSNETNGAQIGQASAEKTKWQFYRTNRRTDAQTFVQFLILSRYVYVKVGLEAFVKKFIFRAIL